MAFIRQTTTLIKKNILIIVGRHAFATTVRALILPVALMAFLGFAKLLFVPPAVFGIGSSTQIRSLQDALDYSAGVGRDTVAFVDNGFTEGDIERVINALMPQVTSAGKNATRLSSDVELNTVCKSSLNGVTPCYGAVVFNASPNEGTGGIWNYTMFSDGALDNGRVNVLETTNSAEIYVLPFQHAIDLAISNLGNSTASTQPQIPQTIDEYPFTALTPQQRADKIRQLYQSALTNFLGVSFIAGVIGVCYHMTGFMATEREIGMSTLVEAMMPTKWAWQPQVSRLLSYHLSFSLIYLPGWVIGSLIIHGAVFAHTSAAIVLIYHILIGLSLASMSILGASFFKKSQLSGVTITIVLILLAIIAQTISYPKTAAVAVLSLLFAPCNYTYFISYMARFEKQNWPTDLTKSAPESPWDLPGIALWIFLIIQIIVYPILGATIERYLYGTGTSGRTILIGEARLAGLEGAVRLEGFTKIYKPGILRRMFSFIKTPHEPVVAAGNLTLTAERGQILALLGANGSGKSTTLDAIAGINRLTSGSITVDGSGGLGIAPQKNVLWDELTVEEHIRILNRLKSPNNPASKEEIKALIESIDLEKKIKARSKTLSGGQKRKVQLGMMLTGGSAVCCVDEVSSGIDPLSRRKIWDILLAERGRRTIIMTTHFLDEADLLADKIAIMSKGTLRAEGSSVELKDRMGGGYRIHVFKSPQLTDTPDIKGVQKKDTFDVVMYIAPSSSLAAEVIRTLEGMGITDYKFSGPTIEDVFLQLAEEVRDETGPRVGKTADSQDSHGEKQGGTTVTPVDDSEKDGLELLSGTRIGYMRQAWILFIKRCIIFKSNSFTYIAAFFIPIIAAGLVTLFIQNQQPVGCTPSDQSSNEQSTSFDNITFFLVGGPSSKFSAETAVNLLAPLFGAVGGSISPSSPLVSALQNNFTLVDTLDEFNNAISQYRRNITPAGLWLGDATSAPLVAYEGSGAQVIDATYGLNFLDMFLLNKTIAVLYQPFAIPWAPSTGNSLQLLVYVGMALAAYPGFFSLYPNLERRRNVRGLEYSNGVRALPLWMAYTAFDFIIVIVSSAIVTILWASLSSIWYHVGYVFLIFTLYGLASILLSYVISILCANQLSAYAFTAAGQAVMLLVYLIAYLCTITYAPVNKLDDYLVLVHFLVAAFAPIGSVVRTLFLELNLFSATCSGEQIAPHPGGILQYGGPILYLIVQSILLFLVLLWLDSGNVGSSFRRIFRRSGHVDEANRGDILDEEVANELTRVTSSAQEPEGASTDGLRALHLTKTFGKNTAVDNVTFGIKRGEVFALLGPNGAGKSTMISLIRGDIKPSKNGGDVLVENVSVTKHLAAARAHLGVCPQFDAIDQMTVKEHLEFYARIRGIPDIQHNVEAVVRAVGLQAFRTRQAFALSGGNKRKLSLGIALMGNPTVVLLDEPSSGLDAAAKRIMWRTLAATVPGRSILLTTHSMEEADALAGRAGILAKRMLAMGTVDQLRSRFGDALHIHLVCRGAPHSDEHTIERIRAWVKGVFPGASVEEKTYHGQMRFSVPARDVMLRTASTGAPPPSYDMAGDVKSGSGGVIDVDAISADGEEYRHEKHHAVVTSAYLTPMSSSSSPSSSQSAIGQLVVMLEEKKEELGIEHYSVSPTTLDQVFLTIVGRHNVQEEGEEEEERKKKAEKAGWWRKMLQRRG